LQSNLFVLGNDDAIGAVGCADVFVSNGEFAEGLSFVVAGGGAGGCDEFVGIISVCGPTVIHGIFFGSQGIGKFKAHAIGVGMIVCDGSSFQRG